MKILVTAGPTHEHLDPVRYLANASSGKMGYAITRAAKRRGHSVTLITGPTHLRPPPGVKTIPVVSAAQMRRAVLREARGRHCLVMAAAVADYRPAYKARRKIPRTHSQWTVLLDPTPDILAEVGARQRPQVLVGFSLETGKGEARARSKMRKKGLDLIIQNSPKTIGSDSIFCRLLYADGRREILRNTSKTSAAARIVKAIEGILKDRKMPPRRLP